MHPPFPLRTLPPLPPCPPPRPPPPSSSSCRDPPSRRSASSAHGSSAAVWTCSWSGWRNRCQTPAGAPSPSLWPPLLFIHHKSTRRALSTETVRSPAIYIYDGILDLATIVKLNKLLGSVRLVSATTYKPRLCNGAKNFLFMGLCGARYGTEERLGQGFPTTQL